MESNITKKTRNIIFHTDASGLVTINPIASYTQQYNSSPYTTNLIKVRYDHKKFLKKIMSIYPNLYVFYEEKNFGYEWNHTVCMSLTTGIDIVFDRLSQIQLNSDISVVNINDKVIKKTTGLRGVNAIQILYGSHQMEEVETILSFFRNCLVQIIDSPVQTPHIGILTDSMDGLQFQCVSLNNDSLSTDLELHYGNDTTEFHTTILNLLQSKTHGLIILNGISGSGRSCYIQNVIADLQKNDLHKAIIFLPLSVMERFTDPNIFRSMLNLSMSYPDGMIFIIEDANNIMHSSRNGHKHPGLSNLLSATDGLINNLLKSQVIVSYDGFIDDIDPSLTRPERLLAYKEFSALNVDKSKQLAKSIGVDPDKIKANHTVGEVYSMLHTESFRQIKQKKVIGF